MSYQGIYNKLKVIAEMEDYWDHPDLIVTRLIRDGYYTDCKPHPDRLKTIQDQVVFIRNIKKILLSDKTDQA